MSVVHFVLFSVLLMFGFLGEIFTLTNIHWHSLHTSTFYIDVVIEFDLGYWAIGETYRKNRFITHIAGTPLD